ncbi:MAG: phage tail protein [Microcystaceae cyanobacterium]
MKIPLRCHLTPLTLPKTALKPVHRQEAGGKALAFSQEGQGDLRSLVPDVVVYPEEMSELAVQLENLTPHFMVLEPTLDGYFPREWYRIIRYDDKLLPLIILALILTQLYSFLFVCLTTDSPQILLFPNEKVDLIIQWKIPNDFFEVSEPISQKQGLILDYQGKINLAYQLSLFHLPSLWLTLRLLIQSGITAITRLFLEKFIYQRYYDTPFNLYVRPDSLYLSFLPDVYKNIDFMGRFLQLFEQTCEPDVNLLDNLWAYFNPLLTSDSFLPFLSHWVGWKLTPALSLFQQRYLVYQAIELYKWRGTRRGLRLYLHLYTGLPLDEMLPETEKHISIEESFGEKFTIGQTSLGRQALIGGGQPYHVKVCLTSLPHQSIDEFLVRQIIEQEKPAFCTYELTLIYPEPS